MGKKGAGKKGGKKKKGDDTEPPHDGSWELAVETGLWEKPVTDLPDANTWPTWGALRERVLIACKQIKINNTASLRDAFCAELVKLSPPELASVDVSGSHNLRNVVVSPMASCPSLTELDLSRCGTLDYVMVQSASLKSLRIVGCSELTKVLIHCPALSELTLQDNPKLETILLWSDELSALDLSGCTGIVTLKPQCPKLDPADVKHPPFRHIEQHIKPDHPPIAFMLKHTFGEAARAAADAKEREWKNLKEDSVIPPVHRPF